MNKLFNLINSIDWSMDVYIYQCIDWGMCSGIYMYIFINVYIEGCVQVYRCIYVSTVRAAQVNIS